MARPTQPDRQLLPGARGDGLRALLLPAIVATAALGVKCVLVAAVDIRALVMAPWVLDDSFIFMRIARNLALGKGYSFNGMYPTSGAPPLWIVLTSLNHFLLSPGAAAKATIIESAALSAASCIMVFSLARRVYDRTIAWIAFLLATFLPVLFFNAMNGMATTLFTFLGLFATWFYVVIVEEGKQSARSYFALGCLLGLTILARADGLFLAFTIIAIEGVKLLRATGQERRRRATGVLVLAASVALLTLPLVIWSLHVDGSLFPANQVGRRLISLEHARLPSGAISSLLVARRLAYNALNMQDLLSIVLGGSVLVMLSVARGLHDSKGRTLTRLIVVYCVSYLGVLVLYQWYFPDVHGFRYLSLPAHLLVIVVAAFCHWAVAHVVRSLWLRRAVVAGVGLLLVLSSAYRYRSMVRVVQSSVETRVLPTYSPEQIATWWSLLDWVSDNIPKGTIMAATDHGTLAYFTGVRVVDLDGILEPESVRCLLDGSIRTYLEMRNVEYVLLRPEMEDRLCVRAIRDACDVEHVEGAPPQVYRFCRTLAKP